MKIQAAIGEYDELLTIIKKRKRRFNVPPTTMYDIRRRDLELKSHQKDRCSGGRGRAGGERVCSGGEGGRVERELSCIL